MITPGRRWRGGLIHTWRSMSMRHDLGHRNEAIVARAQSFDNGGQRRDCLQAISSSIVEQNNCPIAGKIEERLAA